MKTYSQSLQDRFALEVFGRNGTYLEVGAREPVLWNNTKLLEECGWKGVSIDILDAWKDKWSTERTNPLVIDNALKLDYVKLLEEHNLPMHINYLSMDIEPVLNSYLALKRIHEQGITFDCITFEHEHFAKESKRDWIDFKYTSYKYLKSQGHKIAVQNVWFTNEYTNTRCIFETWFVRKDNENYESPQEFDKWRVKFYD